MASTKCFYKVLMVEKSSSPDEIRKAYMKLARKWHPDKNPNNKTESEKRFKEISAAYEILSDPHKRATYDRYGHEGLFNKPSSRQSSGRPTHGHHYDIGSEMFDDDFFGFHFSNPEDLFRKVMRSHMRSFGNVFDFSFGSNLFDDGEMDDDFFQITRPSGNNRPGGNFHQQASSFMSYGASNGGSSAPNTFSVMQSTSTQYKNGKKITTRKVVKNGVETVTVEENGRLLSKTVNKQPVAIQNH